MTRLKPQAFFCECGDHAFAPLTKGYVTLVSPEDAHLLLERRWRAHLGKGHPRSYVTVLSSLGGVLSRRIANPIPGKLVDHINGDTADNRRKNLRECTPAQNSANSKKPLREGNVLPKGVGKKGRRFLARLSHHGQYIHVGVYDTVDEAAAAYRAVSASLNGEFARFE